MTEKTLLYKIALSIIPGIGGVLARNLVTYLGSVEAIFRESPGRLTKIPGIGEVMARRIKEKDILARAEEELRFIEKNKIRVFSYLEDDYPRRFRNCPDAPVLFYLKGNVNLDAEKVISIVGTRSATDYGRQVCETLISELASGKYDLLIVSGLAYGIDIQAHKSSLKYNIPTVGVLGHGLDTLYPSLHSKVARLMMENGGLLTDFPSLTKIDPSNFIRRNRLIAGLSDATIVVESGERGGALITADIAASYDRDVLAFPGRSTDFYSRGCNRLIKSSVAALVENAADVEFILGWESKAKNELPVQQQLFVVLTEEEEKLVTLMKHNDRIYIDMLVLQSEIPLNRISSLLLDLEFKGVVEVLPGNMYRLK